MYASSVKRFVFSLNYVEVSASPMLQKCGHERTRQREHETEEPGCVDKYRRYGRDKVALDGKASSATGVTYSGVRKLLRYLCEEGLSGEVGILMQVRIAEGNKSSHCGGQEGTLECKSDRVC